MARVLIIYGTTEGHTDDVVTALNAPLKGAGHEVVVERVEHAPDDVAAFDGFLVGSSIHMGKHNKQVVEWVRQHLGSLTTRPSAFFQVALSSAADADGANEAKSYIDNLVAETAWHPDLVGLFGGALLYTRYGFVKRAMLKKIAADAGLGTDTHRDYDYTDYEAVTDFGAQFAAMLR